MKTKLNFKRLISNFLIAILVLTVSSVLSCSRKKTTDLRAFKIVVEKTENGIKMESLKGNAWLDLTFSINNDQTQAIDEYGMIDLDNLSTESDLNLADFLFTVTKTKDGIVLKGIEGTA